MCKCNLACAVRQVKKPGKNQHRMFACCPKGEDEGKCDYFSWVGGQKRELEVEPLVQSKPVARTISDAQLVGVPRPRQEVFEPRSPMRSPNKNQLKKAKRLVREVYPQISAVRTQLMEIAILCMETAKVMDVAMNEEYESSE